MKGRRIYPDKKGSLTLAPGDYGKDGEGLWWIRPPKGGSGVLADHNIVEHEDGTITISSSIVGPEYHGFLERGVWHE